MELPRSSTTCVPIVAIILSACVGSGSASDRADDPGSAAARVEIVANDAERRVDILVDGSLFTAYIYPTTIKKPVLYPLRTSSGNDVTRGFPLDPRPGEREDHPHQIGLWFNYGNVNGLDFWNNSDAVPPENAPRMGTVSHREVRGMESGLGRGALEVSMDWVDHEGAVLLREETRFVFHAGPELRAVDRITTLTALDQPISLTDNKEGVLGLRVARGLEQPAERPELSVDSAGRITLDPGSESDGVTGWYRSSEGHEGDAVWGTRGRWTMLSGVVEGEPVTVAILDHPDNVGFPTYWHARGYGLFAANPLGQRELSGGRDVLDYELEAEQSTTFRHRILILSGPVSPEQIDAQYHAFAEGEAVLVTAQ